MRLGGLLLVAGALANDGSTDHNADGGAYAAPPREKQESAVTRMAAAYVKPDGDAAPVATMDIGSAYPTDALVAAIAKNRTHVPATEGTARAVAKAERGGGGGGGSRGGGSAEDTQHSSYPELDTTLRAAAGQLGDAAANANANADGGGAVDNCAHLYIGGSVTSPGFLLTAGLAPVDVNGHYELLPGRLLGRRQWARSVPLPATAQDAVLAAREGDPCEAARVRVFYGEARRGEWSVQLERGWGSLRRQPDGGDGGEGAAAAAAGWGARLPLLCVVDGEGGGEGGGGGGGGGEGGSGGDVVRAALQSGLGRARGLHGSPIVHTPLARKSCGAMRLPKAAAEQPPMGANCTVPAGGLWKVWSEYVRPLAMTSTFSVFFY